MKYDYLDIIFDEDYSEDEDILPQLKKALQNVEKVYLVTHYDNGAKFLVCKGWQNEVIKAVEVGRFKIIEKSVIDGTNTLLLIVTPVGNSTFKELDDERLKAMWG